MRERGWVRLMEKEVILIFINTPIFLEVVKV